MFGNSVGDFLIDSSLKQSDALISCSSFFSSKVADSCPNFVKKSSASFSGFVTGGTGGGGTIGNARKDIKKLQKKNYSTKSKKCFGIL